MTLLQQLPLLARRSWRAPRQAPAQLFRLTADLPALPYDALVVSAGGQDQLSPSLVAALDTLPPSEPDHRDVRHRVLAMAAELRDLGDECADLSPSELTAAASSDVYDLATRYASLLAASACLGVWMHHDGANHFMGDPAWLLAVLLRLGARPGTPPPPLPLHIEQRLFEELLNRQRHVRSYGLNARRLPGSA
jgi:hypothetical protein